jgi:solute carrier family 8 (sodium/calcium exchanger)
MHNGTKSPSPAHLPSKAPADPGTSWSCEEEDSLDIANRWWEQAEVTLTVPDDNVHWVGSEQSDPDHVDWPILGVAEADVAAGVDAPPVDGATCMHVDFSQASSLSTQAAAPADATVERTPTDTSETEPVDLCREHCKAIIAAVSISLFWCILFGSIYIASTSFESPSCNDIGRARRSCHPCGVGTNFLPVFGEFEKSWPKAVQATLYFIGLFWVFLGVGLVCDQFMAAIERITSAERIIWLHVRSGTDHMIRRKVWNSTMANLTLMALGSSAPEIMLNTVEVCSSGFFSGELGPATIVGSAAFNLLIISAVCISAFPGGDSRTIASIDVFMLTATFSLAAYFWMYLVLKQISPDRVQLWEAVVTLLLLPLMIVCAFIADKGWYKKCLRRRKDEDALQHDIQNLRSWMTSEFSRHPSFNKNNISKMVEVKKVEPKRIARSQTRKMCKMGFGDVSQAVKVSRESLRHRGRISESGSSEEHPPCPRSSANDLDTSDCSIGKPDNQKVVSTISTPDSCPEPPGHEEINNLTLNDNRLTTQTATSSHDKGVKNRTLTGLSNRGTLQSKQSARTGFESGHGLSLEAAGTFCFVAPEVGTIPGCRVLLGVRRAGQCQTVSSCRYRTVADSAEPGRDFIADEGIVTFQAQEKVKSFEVQIQKASAHANYPVAFDVELFEPSPAHIQFEGGNASTSCSVFIRRTDDRSVRKGWLDAAFSNQGEDGEPWRWGIWADQIKAACYCSEPEEQAQASVGDWIHHCASLPFKIIFGTLIPPPGLCGGWPCFCLALFMIGLVTAIVGDIGSLLGCAVSIPGDITAITLVALGTSLPDTFASKIAAQEEDTADNSVGNITGSNSVNVFLGLGLPWTIAAIFWHFEGITPSWEERIYNKKTYKEQFIERYPQGGFIVPAGSLGFSVLIFFICAVICISLLMYRRFKYRSELGGPRRTQLQHSIFLVFLWCGYIAASAVNSVGNLNLLD